jgi:hypothetical protein
MGSEGGRENSERIEQGRVGQRARSYTRTPRHVQYRCSQIPAAWDRAGGVFRARAGRDGAGVFPRAGARLGQPRSWRRGDRRAGWWHASVLGQAPARERSREERLEHACEVAWAVDKQLERRAIADAAEARVTAARGLIAAGGVDGPEDIDAVTRAFAACGRAPSGRNRQADLGPCRGCARPGEGALTTTSHVKRDTADRPGADRPADRSGAPDPSLIAAAIARAGIGFEATEHGRTCCG